MPSRKPTRPQSHRDPLGLTWSERRVYDVLFAAGDAYVSQRDIAAAVWSAPTVLPADEVIVRQHISHIRAKLGDRVVESRRATGYRLNPIWRALQRRAAV